jgi:DNA gyrase subunit A
LNRLFVYHTAADNLAIVMLALVENQSQPRILSCGRCWMNILYFRKKLSPEERYLLLKKARERAHLLEGLRIAVDHIDEVIRIIRSSYNDAKERLMERFDLSEIQTGNPGICSSPPQGLERDKIGK